MSEFVLDARLLRDTRFIADLTLCRLLLMNDAHYPWCILVPRRADVREIHRLDERDRRQLGDEVTRVSAALEACTGAHKLNVAALGNVVAQLHVHVVARFDTDAAWPNPVWGKHPTVGYTANGATALIDSLRAALSI